MREQFYGQNCELRKTIEKLRYELNHIVKDTDLDKNSINGKDIIRISRLLDKLIVKCMDCDITECKYNRTYGVFEEGVGQ